MSHKTLSSIHLSVFAVFFFLLSFSSQAYENLGSKPNVQFHTFADHSEEVEEDHSAFSFITGQNTHLIYHDHTFSGKLNEALVWGEGACKDAFALLKIRHLGTTNEVKIVPNDKKELVGKLIKNGIPHTLIFKAIDPENQSIHLDLNGQLLIVKIMADKFEQGHFKNPAYHFTLEGKDYRFKLEENEACWGLSTKLSMLLIFSILGSTHS